MTDQEFDSKLAELMTEGTPEKSEKKRRRFRLPRVRLLWQIKWRQWSRRRKIITGAAAAALVFVLLKGLFGGGEQGLFVTTAPLARGSVEERLSISGPVLAADSAEVVSRLHAEILEILVKEGDIVEKGQVLARLDDTDVQKEVDIARNAYELALANRDEAQRQAEVGYAAAEQQVRTAKLDYDRKAALYAAGDIAKAEMEAAVNALNDAQRQVTTYTLEDGKPVANRSYTLQVKNAEFELEKKMKQLEETEVTSPIAGTVVRVNSRVGRFADTVDDDKPLFAIDNLETLEMKISVSEYSIGKVRVGQEAQIRADILDGTTETGVITAISPTGEEKGGGSTERVVPTTIRIDNPDTKLIAGITARAQIVLNEAHDVWVVPTGAIVRQGEESYLMTVENGIARQIPVETGVESDVDVEIRGDGLTEGLSYIISPGMVTDGMAVNAVQTASDAGGAEG